MNNGNGYQNTRRPSEMSRQDVDPLGYIDMTNLSDYDIVAMLNALPGQTRRRFCNLNPRLIGLCQLYIL